MRIAFTTLGCRLNLFETEAMGRRVSGQAAVVAWEEEAEVYVINSCAVTARAEQKCRQLARGAKRRRPEARVVVVGCASQINGRPLMDLPEIDAALGNEEKKRLDEWLPRIAAGERFLAAAPFPERLTLGDAEWVEDFAGRSRATIKVQEGCRMRCTFCAIWAARGPSRSRPPRDVVDQARQLSAAGYEEIVLGGVHLGHYGRDLSPRRDLRALLEMLLELVDERVRFRLSSIDPSEVDRPLVELLTSEPRLCRYLHLPLQSGSPRILRAMRRAYAAASYRHLVEEIASRDPLFGLGVDVIVGFPGEDARAFEETRRLLESLPVSFYHVFPYSDRPGTPASAMPEKVDGPTMGERARILRALGETKRAAFLAAHRGRIWDGVVEAGPVDGRRRGIMLDDYATLWAVAGSELGGRRVRALAEMVEGGRLLGRLVLPSEEAGGPRSDPLRRTG
jgi:threonylcarbamoyladenosine tRNA methylthiotransferase MtaB